MAQWYNGRDSMRIDGTFETDASKQFVRTIDPNAGGITGLVNCHKVQLRILSNLALHTIRAHITHDSWKFFLAHCEKFSFISEKDGSVLYDGLIFIRMMISILKPETIVDVRTLELELDSITL